MRSIANQLSILCQHATIDSALGLFPSFETSGDFCFADVHADGVCLSRDRDDIAVLDYGYGSTN